MSEHFLCSPLGDSALIISFGNTLSPSVNRQVQQAAVCLSKIEIPGIIELVPAYTTLTVFYDPCQTGSTTPYETVQQRIILALKSSPPCSNNPGKLIEIPVCYETEFAPDLPSVAQHNRLSIDEVIELHTANTYQVYFLGFAPGFPFLGGMDKRLSTPRLTTPRQSIPAGSVGIAGEQTGVYPLSTPGGWQLIGHTPLPLVNFELDPPAILQPGDRIRFKSISRDEHTEWETSL